MNSLRSLGAGDRATRSSARSARSSPASGSCRRRATGTKPTVARTRCASKEGSSRLPLLPRARPRAGRADRRDARRGARRSMPELPAARRARLVERVGDQRDRRARARRRRRASPTTPRRRSPRSTAARRSDVVNWVHRRRARLPQRDAGCRPRCCRSRPTCSPSSSASSPTGTISRNQAKDVLDECLREPKRPKQVVEERGLAQVSDAGELGAVVDAGARRQRRRGRRVPRRRRQGPQEEARLPHGRGDEGAQGQGQPPGRQPAPRRPPHVTLSSSHFPRRFLFVAPLHVGISEVVRTMNEVERVSRRWLQYRRRQLARQAAAQGMSESAIDSACRCAAAGCVVFPASIASPGAPVTGAATRDGRGAVGRRDVASRTRPAARLAAARRDSEARACT